MLRHLLTVRVGRIQNYVHALLHPQGCLIKSLFILLINYMIIIAWRNRCLLSLFLSLEDHLLYVEFIKAPAEEQVPHPVPALLEVYRQKYYD